MATVWLIRNDVFNEELEREGFVSLGWDEVGDLHHLDLDTASLVEQLKKTHNDSSRGSLIAWSGTLRRFYDEFEVGDIVVAPYEQSKYLRIGTVTGNYYFDDTAEIHKHRRPVRWAVTDLQKDLLPVKVRNGLKSIQTLSRVKRNPEFYEAIAANPSDVAEQIHELEAEIALNGVRDVWLVSAFIGQEDRSDAFVRDGYWALADGIPAEAADMRTGDRIAIKSSFVRKLNLPFEANGRSISCLSLKARGIITAVQQDRVLVDWDIDFAPREWYFYTNRTAVWRLDLEDQFAKQLEAFIFDDAGQNYAEFLADERWSPDQSIDDAPTRPGTRLSYRVSRPSAGIIYDVADEWRQSLVDGRSLFTNEPFDYAAAVNDLIDYFVNQPDTGSGTFFEKLQTQLESASDAAVQLAAELYFMYCLPLLPSSMRASTKHARLDELLGWRDSLVAFPERLAPALDSGILAAGTGYQTYRWRIFQFLIEFVARTTSLPREQRHDSLHNHAALVEIFDAVQVPASSSMRRLLEHLWFPETAMASNSAEDRRRMVSAFAEVLSGDDANSLINELDANLRYGDRYELNLHAAPHVFVWRGPSEQQRTWAAWASLVREGLEPEPTTPTTDAVTLESLPRILGPLYELQTDAARTLIDWIGRDSAATVTALEASRRAEPSQAIDQLQATTDFEGDVNEFVEAASTLLFTLNPARAQFFRTNIAELRDQLANIDSSVAVSPGEIYQVLLEGVATLQWTLLEREGIDLSVAATADLAQQTLELNPNETDWPIELVDAFRDWRDGRRIVSPDSIQVVAIDRSKPEGREVPPARTHAPQTLDELAESLGFTTAESRDWLTLTRDLLLDKRQIILQGPPGTGKTFVARALARFLSRDSDRVTLVQFHPATSYEDFVQGLRPNPEVPGAFALRNGPLIEVAELARRDPDHLHVLVIDEINRANLPAVFGELYFLLEYRDAEATLNYGDRFRLPPNLLVIGTMNTADRSIAAIDAALRRRFMIRDLRPGQAPMTDVLDAWLDGKAPDLAWLGRLLDEANRIIGDPDQAIGPSHFLLHPEQLNETNVRRAWEFTVMPTMRELFYGQPERVARLEFAALKSAVLRIEPDAAAD